MGRNPYGMPWTLVLIAGGMGPSLVGVAGRELVAPVSDRVEVSRSLLALAVGLAVCALAERRTRLHSTS